MTCSYVMIVVYGSMEGGLFLNQMTHLDQQMIDDLCRSLPIVYPEYRRVPIEKGKYHGIVYDGSDNNHVSVVVGAGSGNEPWCMGYVGQGLANGGVIGSIFTAPSARAVLTVTRAVPHKRGVVYICENYAGDVLNFELASELASLDGIQTGTIAVTDDIASAPIAESEQRRGIAGVLFVVKVAGGAAALGMNLEDVLRVTAKANANTRSFSVYTTPIRDPETNEIVQDLPEGMVNMGGGFNGETGKSIEPFISLDSTVNRAFEYLMEEIQPLPTAEMCVLINAFGDTTEEEMLLIGRQVLSDLNQYDVRVHHILFEHAFSPRQNGGFSISLMTLDEELKYCYEQPADSPFIHGFQKLINRHKKAVKK